ncbi:DUF1289 domain-containing protein [Kaistia algarum]|uniref:DUF1289 domain-containing protein n=1 Tax=Kaistia algarum TaxID=2083279 RepID=UPI000CE8AF27|nr:DUF1289 domain-containing protein [Kaistia algarum]MCX5514658.1 DUF1289 domain-containing protein [Kaistia algarum]PPE78910.1 DUF1289 domain-containing protein [Kaistia algarum]
MITPCIKLCALDAERRACLGCGRTLAEIAGWSSFSDGERARIMTELASRLAKLAKPEPA